MLILQVLIQLMSYGQNATLLNSPPTPHGVEVELRALNSDGTVVDLGTVTTDSSGHFAKTWVPSAEGTYTVYAAFAGSESYWSSSVATALGVEAAPEISSSQAETVVQDNTMMFVASTAAIIIAIAIVGILLFRKRT